MTDVFSHVSLARALHTGRPYAIAAEPSRIGRLWHVPERHTVQLWLDALRPDRAFLTMDGAEVRVLSPGTANRYEGPDFLAAEIIVDGRLVRGAIEVHTHADDWWKHGHDSDPAYRAVVLHVCLYAPTRRGALPPTLLLPGQIDAPLRETWSAVIPTRHPMACADMNKGRSHPDTDVMLLLMAVRRFRRKCDRIQARYERHALVMEPGDALRQTAWEAVARAAGYGGNEDRMERAASALTIKSILALPSASRAVRMSAAAGKSSAYSGPVGWRQSGVSPSNRPAPRLRWLAAWAGQLADEKWWELLNTVASHADPDIEAYGPLFRIRGEQGSPGPERLSEILTNVVAPLLHLVSGLRDDVRLARAARALYFTLSPAASNRITRIVAPILEPATPRSSQRQQGMIELFTLLCSSAQCGTCLLSSTADRKRCAAGL